MHDSDASPSIDLRRDRGADLTVAEIHAIVALEERVWPTNQSVEALVREFARADDTRRGRVAFRMLEHGRLLASAERFVRTMRADERPLEIGCLAGVCVVSERRGEGLGAALVREVFADLPNAPFDVMLFQTGVPGFYTRLGARSVRNRFVNRGSDEPEANPWWDEHVMIFPAQAEWPDGIIDLNGPGY